MANVYLDYEIHLGDKALVDELTAARSRWNFPRNEGDGDLVPLNEPFTGQPLGGTGYLFAAPERAAREYADPSGSGASPAATIVKEGDPIPDGPPYLTSSYFLSDDDADADKVEYDKDSFSADSGVLGFVKHIFGFGKTAVWRGRYVYAPTEPVQADGTVDDDPEPIQTRYWIDGFEQSPGTGASTEALAISRDASRVPGGFGLALRNGESSSTGSQVNQADRGDSAGVTKMWTRFYMRVRRLPGESFTFWKAQTTALASAGVGLALLPSGQLACVEFTNSVQRTMGTTLTTKLEVDRWYRIDILHGVGVDQTTSGDDGPTDAQCRLFVDGVEEFNITGFAADGLGAWNASPNQPSTAIDECFLGRRVGGQTTPCDIDFDDWIMASYPTKLTGWDWLNGSHIVALPATAFAEAPTGWTDVESIDARAFNCTPAQTNLSLLVLDDAAASAAVRFTLDLTPVTAEPKAINQGIVAARAGLWLEAAGDTDEGSIDLTINGTAHSVDLGTVNSAATPQNIPYYPSDLTEPVALASASLGWTIDDIATGDDQELHEVLCQVEMIGVFQPCDALNADAGEKILEPAGSHNGRYPFSPWAWLGTAPVSGVEIKSGTYDGNGVATELEFDVPVHFLWIRKTTGTSNAMGPTWWSTVQASPIGFAASFGGQDPVRVTWRAATDDGIDGVCRVVITGSDAYVNADGSTYQYVAFCDPGMRFCLNQALRSGINDEADITNLIKDAFTPEWAFVLAAAYQSGSTGIGVYVKGPGNADDGANLVGTGEDSDLMTFGAGTLTVNNDDLANFVHTHYPISCWRNDDGSGDPGIPATLQILSWTGDGASSRTIQLRTSGKRPLWALAVRHSTGLAYFRDPSHTGTNSSNFSGSFITNKTTAITGGGIDSISVGSDLNANGAAYSMLVFMGSATAGNGGWSENGTFLPVVPIPPADWPGGTGADDAGGDDGEDGVEDTSGEGGGTGGGGTTPVEPGGEDLGEQCVSGSQKLINQALSYLGISSPIVDLADDDTPEATLARLHYADAVAEALRDFPWPFATRYADLVHVAGSEAAPVNGDWTYSYRIPDDLIFARRLVRPEIGRRFDPHPPRFRTGADDTGRLLYTSYRDPASDPDAPTVELEYTFRPDCVAAQGDALFRRALSWLMAHKLAPALSRNKVTAADAYGMYLTELAKAETVAAREHQASTVPGEADWIRARDGGGCGDDSWRRH